MGMKVREVLECERGRIGGGGLGSELHIEFYLIMSCIMFDLVKKQMVARKDAASCMRTETLNGILTHSPLAPTPHHPLPRSLTSLDPYMLARSLLVLASHCTRVRSRTLVFL
jgi:hypothetical protein